MHHEGIGALESLRAQDLQMDAGSAASRAISAASQQRRGSLVQLSGEPVDKALINKVCMLYLCMHEHEWIRTCVNVR